MERVEYEVVVAEDIVDFYTNRTDMDGRGIDFYFSSLEKALEMVKFALDQGYEARVKKRVYS